MPRLNPKEYQRAIARFFIANQHAGAFADPGLGKTATSLIVWRALLATGLARRCLLVAPLRVATTTWPDEMTLWDQFDDIDSVCFTGWGDSRALDLFYGDHSIYIITPDSLAWLVSLFNGDRAEKLRANIAQRTDGTPAQVAANKRDEKTIARLEQLAADFNLEDFFDTLIVDESTKFKNWSAKRFKVLKKLLPNFNRRYILTGTPSPNGVGDLFAQIYILDLGATLGKSRYKFEQRYGYKDHFKQWHPYETSADKIREKIAPLVIRLDADDHLDLPEILYNDVFIEMPSAVRKDYKTLETKLFLKLDSGGQLTPGSAGATYNLCRQLANGGVYLYDEIVEGDEIKRIRTGVEHRHNVKTAAAADLVDELFGKPVLIAYQFGHDLERLQKQFGDRPTIRGGTSAADTKRIVDDWNSKKIPILFCQPQAMSHGLNMQTGGNDIIWLGLTDNQETYDQLNRRIYRQGVTGRVRIHHLILRDTVDEAVLANVRRKTSEQKTLLDALNDYRKKDNLKWGSL